MELTKRRLEPYCDLVIHRWDIYARQREQGDYVPVQRPLTPQLVRQHLEGEVTLGVYALAQDNTARWAVIDSDAEEGLYDLQALWSELHRLQIPAYLEASRRGGHLWLFFKPQAAQAIFYFTHWLLKKVGFKKRVEVFPKELNLNADGGGSLVRAPLGIHRISNKRYGFVDPVTLKSPGRSVMDQLQYIQTFQRVPSHRVAETLAEAVAYRFPRKPEAGGEVAALAKRIGDLYQSVSQSM